ncbi:MAG: hypothetical protein KF901_29715 [Myxococcales bacterium]|nr:hypothetical protein [Myxococcales bacterium]
MDDPMSCCVDMVVDVVVRGAAIDPLVYALRMVTPSYLCEIRGDAVLAHRGVVVMDAWDSESVWAWVESVVAACDVGSTEDIVDLLGIHFEPIVFGVGGGN